MSSILTNTSAMVALQTLKGINSSLEATQSEISTGKSVSSAKDNSAVWAISKVMEADVNGFTAISDSLSLGESSIAVGQKAAETVTDLLTEMKGKIVAAQEENVDRGKLQTDIQALRDQISSVVGAAQFNGLNLVKGTDDVNVLSSLDRSSDGTVSASHITVARQDLSTDVGSFGTGISDAASAGYATITDATNTDNTSTTTAATGSYVEIDITADNSSSYSLTIDGHEVTYDSDASATTAEIQAGFATAINALGIEGLTVDTGTADTLILRNTNAFEDMSVTATAGTPASFAVDNLNGTAITATNTEQTLAQRAQTIDFSSSAQVDEGRGFKVTVGSDSFSYVAGKGENMEDVARGLKAAIDSAGVDGVTAEVQYDETNEQWQLAVDDTTGGQTLKVTANDGQGTASGGLFGLDGIDVTTDAGAQAALGNIETLINNSIDAAAEFGSAAGRVETQNEFISGLTDSLNAGIGSLVDADMEAASAKLQALQVQQQLGTQALSIANQAPQNILSLFR